MTSTYPHTDAPRIQRRPGVLFAGAFGAARVLLVS
jgi:hypothetical protein